MTNNDFSVTGLQISPLKSSVALSLWTFSASEELEELHGVVGTDYTFDAEIVSSRNYAGAYNVLLTLHSESQNFHESVLCLDSSRENKKSFKDMPLNTAKSLIRLLKEENDNAYEHFLTEGRKMLVPQRPSYMRYPFVVATDPVLCGLSIEEQDSGFIDFFDTERERVLDVKNFLEINQDMSAISKECLKGFARANRPYMPAARFVSICVGTYEPDYVVYKSAPPKKSDSQEKSIWAKPAPGFKSEKENKGRSFSYPDCPSLYAHYAIGFGKMKCIGESKGPQLALDFMQDMNDLVINSYLSEKENRYDTSKKVTNAFCPKRWEKTLMLWDEAAAKPIEPNKRSRTGRNPYGSDNMLFAN